jgi:hypothetical protein
MRDGEAPASRRGVRFGTAGAVLVSAPRCRLREASSGSDALAFDGAVDRGAADAEEFGHLGGAVLAAVHQRDEVRFLAAVELGLLATQPAFGLGDLHALAGAEPDQVGLDYVDSFGPSSRMAGRTVHTRGVRH